MKTYSRSEIRRDQWELLQLKAYATVRFLRERLIADETTDEEDIVDTIERILRWDRVLLATCRLLGSSSEVFYDSDEVADSPASLIAA